MISKKHFHKHPVLVTIIVLLALFGISYLVGSVYYQKDFQIKRIASAINDPKQNLAKYVIATNPDVEVTEDKLKPLQSYFKENEKQYRQLKADLHKQRENQQLKLVENGSYFLLFPKYSLRVKVYHPQVHSNHPSSFLMINKKALGQMRGADQNFYTDLGWLFPGRYHLSVKTNVSGRKLTADSIANIWSDKTINMAIKTGTFLVRSVPDGQVYINDRKVKTLDKNGQATFKNYPLAKDTELFVKTKYQDQTIKSEKVTDLSSAIASEFAKSDDDVSDYDQQISYSGNQNKDVYQDVEGDYVVNPIWSGLISKKIAAKLLTKVALKPKEEDFEEKKLYQKQKKQVKAFAKNKQRIKTKVIIRQILPAGNEKSLVSYQLVYKFHQNGKSKKQVINYQDILFHKKGEQQLIVDLGKKK